MFKLSIKNSIQLNKHKNCDDLKPGKQCSQCTVLPHETTRSVIQPFLTPSPQTAKGSGVNCKAPGMRLKHQGLF